MSDTFDDMFGSDDEQQTPQSTTTTQSTTMGDLFGDDEETQTSALTTSLPTTQASATTTTPTSLKSLKIKAYGDQALGAPDDIYVQDVIKTGEVDKQIILLTVPRIVGADINEYDPEKFDRLQCAAQLPPYQREYTQGVESMIRFRIIEQPDGTKKKVSNSRIVEWENGDVHLQVGRQYFPLTVKQQRISVDQSADLLMFQSNGLYYHVGSIISSWKTSIAPHHLTDYRERMTAVQARLAELDKQRRNIQEKAAVPMKPQGMQ